MKKLIIEEVIAVLEAKKNTGADISIAKHMVSGDLWVGEENYSHGGHELNMESAKIWQAMSSVDRSDAMYAFDKFWADRGEEVTALYADGKEDEIATIVASYEV